MVTIAFKLLLGASIALENIKFLPILLVIPIINIALAYGVFKYAGQIYRLVAILAILSLIRSMPLDFSTIFGYADFAFASSLIFLGFYLNSKLCPGFESKREYYTNEYGENRGRDIIYFRD